VRKRKKLNFISIHYPFVTCLDLYISSYRLVASVNIYQTGKQKVGAFNYCKWKCQTKRKTNEKCISTPTHTLNLDRVVFIGRPMVTSKTECIFMNFLQGLKYISNQRSWINATGDLTTEYKSRYFFATFFTIRYVTRITNYKQFIIFYVFMTQSKVMFVGIDITLMRRSILSMNTLIQLYRR
jgi:hypothetical protein